MYSLLTKLTLLTALSLVSGAEPGYAPQCPPGEYCKPKPYGGGCECCPIPPNPCYPPESGFWDGQKWCCPKPPEPVCPTINWNFLIGTEVDQAAGIIRFQDGKVVPIHSVHKPIRIIIKGQGYDKSFNPDRLNIEIERNYKGCWVICKVWCG